MEEQPDIVLVQGDTNTVLAGTRAAAKLHIRVGQVEVGFVSFDRMMPEEINRVVADHISDMLFAPTETARQNLLNEGIEDNKISVTGNTVVDAVFQNLDISKEESEYPRHSWHSTGGYFLITAHRQENVDSPEHLRNLIRGHLAIHQDYSLPVILPMHPRTRKMVEQFNIPLCGISVIEPTG
ncbi:MAG: UDP-N-acetylglucosamine 2-epimerase, partial [Methanoregula sp.]|nr:UDP-N-acetylglucosamine 2-epimerase [Methanoregula sp.]